MKTQNTILGGMLRIQSLMLTVLLCGFALSTAAQDPVVDTPTRVLLKSVYRLSVVEQIATQAKKLTEQSDAQQSQEVEIAVEEYRSSTGETIRAELEAMFGNSAREEFGGFVEAFSKAEAEKNLEFLARIIGSAGEWSKAPASYVELRRAMVEDVLKEDIAAAGNFLSEIQTWLDLQMKAEDVPKLSDWLSRDNPVKPAVETPAKPKRKQNPLRDAEASAVDYEGGDEDGAGSLESFGAARSERRQKSLEDARAGMQQIAEERRVAEDEVASKKMAAAQAEAEAVRKHAEKLASSESEAIEQRKNSWSGRLKSILSTTIGATSGAFLGNVGSRAGEAAADAVFNTESEHRR